MSQHFDHPFKTLDDEAFTRLTRCLTARPLTVHDELTHVGDTEHGIVIRRPDGLGDIPMPNSWLSKDNKGVVIQPPVWDDDWWGQHGFPDGPDGLPFEVSLSYSVQGRLEEKPWVENQPGKRKSLTKKQRERRKTRRKMQAKSRRNH